MVVQPVIMANNEIYYQIEMCNKSGVPVYPPLLKFPNIYPKSAALRNFILAKCTFFVFISLFINDINNNDILI